MLRNQITYSLLVGYIGNPENITAASYQTKHILIVQPTNCTLGYLSQKNENLRSHSNLYMNVHGSFVKTKTGTYPNVLQGVNA